VASMVEVKSSDNFVINCTRSGGKLEKNQNRSNECRYGRYISNRKFPTDRCKGRAKDNDSANLGLNV